MGLESRCSRLHLSGRRPVTQLGRQGVHITEGKWTFLSGVHHADWIVVNAVLPPRSDEDGAPSMISLLVPKGDYEILDDWHTAALRGTGTSGVRLENV